MAFRNSAGAEVVPSTTRTLKILLVGDSGVGKTAFMHRYVNGVFLTEYKTTVGVDFAQKYVLWHGENENIGLNLQIWDIAGQDRFASMTRVYYRDAHGAIVIFDLSNSRTFDGAAKWKADVDQKCRLLDGSPIPCLLLGNKSDLRMRDVGQGRIEHLGNRAGFIGWAECSVRQNIFIDDSVMFLLEHVLQRLSIAEVTAAKEMSPGKLSPVQMESPIIRLPDNNLSMVVDNSKGRNEKTSDSCC